MSASTGRQTPGSLRLFYCYSHKDELMRAELEAHLKPLERDGIIDGWFDGMIMAGSPWGENISQQLSAADIIISLVSKDFLSSKFIIEVELKYAIQREIAG